MTAELRHSYSSLELFHRCPRAWWYKHIDKYESIGLDGSLAALRGTAFHALAQAHLVRKGAREATLLVRNLIIEPVPGLVLVIDWLDPSRPTIAGPDLGPEEALGPESVLFHISLWERRQEESFQALMVDAYGDTLTNRLGDLWHRYMNHWGEEDEHYHPLLVEYEWARRTPGGVLLQGRLDSVGWNSHLGLVEVRDIKTHENWPQMTDEVISLFDSQLHLQAWGVAPTLREHAQEDDWTPRAMVFDRVRFKMPTAPQLTKAGKLDRRYTDFSPEGYVQFCHANGMEVDESVYNGASAPGKWFRRKSEPVNINTITAQVLGLEHLAQRAEETTEKTAIMLPTKSCDFCSYNRLCEEELRGGRRAIDKTDLHMFGLTQKES